MTVVVFVLLGVVALVVVVAGIVGVRRSRRGGTVVPAPIASAADSDLWNAAGISGATGHAWMAGDRAARARAVTHAARRGPRD